MGTLSNSWARPCSFSARPLLSSGRCSVASESWSVNREGSVSRYGHISGGARACAGEEMERTCVAACMQREIGDATLPPAAHAPSPGFAKHSWQLEGGADAGVAWHQWHAFAHAASACVEMPASRVKVSFSLCCPALCAGLVDRLDTPLRCCEGASGASELFSLVGHGRPCSCAGGCPEESRELRCCVDRRIPGLGRRAFGASLGSGWGYHSIDQGLHGGQLPSCGRREIPQTLEQQGLRPVTAPAIGQSAPPTILRESGT